MLNARDFDRFDSKNNKLFKHTHSRLAQAAIFITFGLVFAFSDLKNDAKSEVCPSGDLIARLSLIPPLPGGIEFMFLFPNYANGDTYNLSQLSKRSIRVASEWLVL